MKPQPGGHGGKQTTPDGSGQGSNKGGGKVHEVEGTKKVGVKPPGKERKKVRGGPRGSLEGWSPTTLSKRECEGGETPGKRWQSPKRESVQRTWQHQTIDVAPRAGTRGGERA